MIFQCSLAGKIIQIHAIYDSTREFCRNYLCEGTPELTVTIEAKDIAFEREKSAREDALEGLPVRHFSDAYLETLAVYRKIANWMIQHDTLLFHGSVVVVDGKACLFTAKSGTGKSTHTRLWRQLLGDRAVMINDDKPLLRITDEQVLAYGTPWDGKHRLSTNTSVPLQAICILERGETNAIRPIPAVQALPMLVQQSHRPADPAGIANLLELLDRLSARVSFYRLSCNMDPEAARVAYEGMFRK